ncbi:hypothetical protein M758_12G067300 [Ceratodon purpureus]|nr:hypothetical protein M758_12G067300 [Ceratodon purpureus]
MIGHFIVLFASFCTLVGGFVTMPFYVKNLLACLSGSLTIVPCLVSFVLFIKEISDTKHGKLRFLIHIYLKSSFNDYGQKKILSMLPSWMSYHDFFSKTLAEGNLNIFVFGKQSISNRVDQIIIKKDPVKLKYIFCSLFINKLKILCKNRKTNSRDITSKGLETGATIRDVEVKIYFNEKGLKVTFRNLITLEFWEDFINQKGLFSANSFRLFNYARKLIWDAKSDNCYFIDAHLGDNRNLIGLNYKQVLNHIRCQSSYKQVKNWKCIVG